MSKKPLARRSTVSSQLCSGVTDSSQDSSFQSSSTKLSERSPKFLVSTPMYIPDDMSGDSGDESESSEFSGKFDFDINDLESFPFRTFTIVKSKKVAAKVKIVHQIGSASFSDIKQVQASELVGIDAKGSKVADFLRKLKRQAFEEGDEASGSVDDISVSLGLNKKHSISTRSNDSLKKEFKAALSVSSPIKHKEVAFFWEVKWYDKDGKEVDYNTAKSFYKQLKRKHPDSAKEFLRINESEVGPPYQELREVLRVNLETQDLLKYYRASDAAAPIYFTLIDADTVSFNGIFSAYTRIIRFQSAYPTVMSTGYEFWDSTNLPLEEASKIDRAIRVATAKHIPTGVYYPEPNTCVLIPEGDDMLSESFIDSTIKEKNLESVVLLREVVAKRSPASVFIFSDDNPLITAIPSRTTVNKQTKKPLVFSTDYRRGVEPPTEADIKELKEISQSHFNVRVLAVSLYYLKHFKIQGSGNNYKVIRFLNCQINMEDDSEIDELFNMIIIPEMKAKLIEIAKSYTNTIEIFFGKNFREQLDIEYENFAELGIRARTILSKLYNDHSELLNTTSIPISQFILYPENLVKFIGICDLPDIAHRILDICDERTGPFQDVNIEELYEFYEEIEGFPQAEEYFKRLITDEDKIFKEFGGDYTFKEIADELTTNLTGYHSLSPYSRNERREGNDTPFSRTYQNFEKKLDESSVGSYEDREEEEYSYGESSSDSRTSENDNSSDDTSTENSDVLEDEDVNQSLDGSDSSESELSSDIRSDDSEDEHLDNHSPRKRQKYDSSNSEDDEVVVYDSEYHSSLQGSSDTEDHDF